MGNDFVRKGALRAEAEGTRASANAHEVATEKHCLVRQPPDQLNSQTSYWQRPRGRAGLPLSRLFIFAYATSG